MFVRAGCVTRADNARKRLLASGPAEPPPLLLTDVEGQVPRWVGHWA